MEYPYPRKDAPTDKSLIPAIKRRWSAFAFSDQPIEQEKIDTLFEAVRWTQSSRNEQPWRMVYATKQNPEEYQRLASLLTEGNAYAARAYLLLLGCAVLHYDYQHRPNRHAQYDTGAAMHALFLQAVDLGLIAHEMGGFDVERAHSELDISDTVEPMAMMAIGYPGDVALLNEEIRKRHDAPRKRKTPVEFAFKGKWPA